MPCDRESCVFENCLPIKCPCPGGCEGTLKSDGRNVQDDLTFLQCDTCGCAYVAEDFPKKEGEITLTNASWGIGRVGQ